MLEPLTACLYRRRQYKQYGHLEWVSNATLQLQRLAYEGADAQRWDKCTEDIPVPATNEPLVCLDTRDGEHPRLPRRDMPVYVDQSSSSHLMSEVPRIRTESKQPELPRADLSQSEISSTTQIESPQPEVPVVRQTDLRPASATTQIGSPQSEVSAIWQTDLQPAEALETEFRRSAAGNQGRPGQNGY